MRRRMIAHGRAANAVGNDRLDAITNFQRAVFLHAVMTEYAAFELLRVLHVEASDRAAIANLSTGLGIERRVVEHDHAGVADIQCIDRLAVAIQRENIGRSEEHKSEHQSLISISYADI